MLEQSGPLVEQDGADAVQDGADARPDGAPRLPGFGPPSSGNRAFDEYRMETLRRLEEEQTEFRDFLDRLRHAKDKEEFDQFMAQHRTASDAAPDGQPQALNALHLSLQADAPILRRSRPFATADGRFSLGIRFTSTSAEPARSRI